MDWFGNKQNGNEAEAKLPYGARLRGAVTFDDLLGKLDAKAFNFDWPTSPRASPTPTGCTSTSWTRTSCRT